MEWPKIKNIIIFILLLVNGFLLVLVLGQQRRVLQYERSAVTRAAQVLEQNGISVSDGILDKRAALPSLSAARDHQAEEAVARALLGDDVARTDQSGGLYVYSSSRGSVLFRVTGEFSAALSGFPLSGQTPAHHAAALLEQMGLAGEQLSCQEEAGGSAVTFLQLLDGVPLYSCRLTFQYSDQQLLSISGTLLTGETALAAEAADPLDLPTVLIRFLDGILDRGDVCSAINDLRLGYRSTQTFGSGVRLSPVWLVSTNIADYYLDGVTGQLEPVY